MVESQKASAPGRQKIERRADMADSLLALARSPAADECSSGEGHAVEDIPAGHLQVDSHIQVAAVVQIAVERDETWMPLKVPRSLS